MPKQQRRAARVERREDMRQVREENVENLGRAEAEGQHSRGADFHRNY